MLTLGSVVVHVHLLILYTIYTLLLGTITLFCSRKYSKHVSFYIKPTHLILTYIYSYIHCIGVSFDVARAFTWFGSLGVNLRFVRTVITLLQELDCQLSRVHDLVVQDRNLGKWIS